MYTVFVQRLEKNIFHLILGLAFMMHPLIFSTEPSGLYLSTNFFLNFPHIQHGWGKFSNLWGSDYWKTHLQLKKLNLDVFIHAQGKTSP